MSSDDEMWGPSHQRMDPPQGREPSLGRGCVSILGWVVLVSLLDVVRIAVGLGSGGTLHWIVIAAVALVLLRIAMSLGVGILARPPRVPTRPLPRPPATSTPLVVRERPTPAARAREGLERVGGGAYLGVHDTQEWAAADPQSAAMILGPPRSGKTSAVMIPALLASSGPVVSTSTKPDVMRATLNARGEIGELWLFDPSGTEPLPDGVRRLCWSPVTAAATWDGALLIARAMTAASRAGAGTSNETHWAERAAALLAPLLYAANQTSQPIEEVLRWTLRQDLAPALGALADTGSPVAADVLLGIQRTDARERSSIFSATAGVLAAYNADGARTSAASPNFDPTTFATSTDTLYITSPEQHQAACAPLIVGLLEQIRHATYTKARTNPPGGGQGMLWLLDEIANIAPIHDLPALASQAGGQNLQIVIGLQDLSQARARWGQDAADGFLTLFQTKLILTGIADTRTLEAVSLALGEYDRDTVTHTIGRSDPEDWHVEPTHSDTVSYNTQRQRILTLGEIAKLPAGHGLLLQGNAWELVRLTKWYETEPWKTIGGR
ncbi:MAG: type IV secretory system conjugative DNA transfer family protein [Solirubrobacteraceae bacterium]